MYLVPYNLDLPLRSPDCEDLKVEDDVHGVLALKSTSTVEVDRQSEVLPSLLPLSPPPLFSLHSAPPPHHTKAVAVLSARSINSTFTNLALYFRQLRREQSLGNVIWR